MNSAAVFHTSLIGAVFSLGLFCTSHVYADDSLWTKLAEGGKVVLMRHGAVVTGRGNGDSLLRDPSCKKERNLSDEGRQQAKLIGGRFRERNIAIEAVRYSPYCRTTDTAQIAFGGGSEVAYLSLLEVQGAEAAAAQTEELNRVIGSYAGKGNLVLVTHEPNINAVSFEMLKPADFLVLQPKGGSEFDELGVMRWSESN